MNNSSVNSKAVYLKDYKELDFKIEKINLIFEIDCDQTIVTNEMIVKKQKNDIQTPFFLNGENLELLEISIDEKVLENSLDYKISETGLEITRELSDHFKLLIKNKIKPRENTDLQGLYMSGDLLCTQNEPQGFRNITYFTDRPDCMTLFTTKIIGDKNRFPTMLSNGNKVDFGELENGKHFVVWEDPSLKPSYLFALVAGKLGCYEDQYITKNKKEVKLQIFCDLGNENKCSFAMKSLQNAMKWDEDRFNLIYDLDIYMIVAVDSFNFGAMENKGLNIFNSAYVLADPSSATDSDYAGIEGVIGHEYFHNWTGNRVTCRDWFQLTLKEGLTVFRDQEFSGDMNSKMTNRIADVSRLKNAQFPEDSGPTAHPIKPKSYIEINNFYTPTIYEKGAEIIRMIHTFLGEENFQKGIKLYFERHDGHAVTTEDFISAMSDGGDFDFTQFQRWYHQSGTPVIKFQDKFDADKKIFTLTIEQFTPASINEPSKLPLFMPYKIGLLGLDQKPKIESSEHHLQDDLFIIKEKNQQIIFSNINSKPVLSLNRGFSAPVKTQYSYSIQDLATILASDTDLFNRYQASQDLAEKIIHQWLESNTPIKEQKVDLTYLKAIGKLLENENIDLSVKANSLILPSLNILGQSLCPVDYCKINEAREKLKKDIALFHKDLILSQFKKYNSNVDYKFFKTDVSNRVYKNQLLSYLFCLDDQQYLNLVTKQYFDSNNMNDRFFAMNLISQKKSKQRDEVINHFYDEWKNNTLVICKWFQVLSGSSSRDTFELVNDLENNLAFDFKVPNHVRALWANFAKNLIHFHHESGRGYKLLKNKIIFMDKINSRVASGLCNTFRDYKNLPPNLKQLMKVELEEIQTTKGLTKDCLEIINQIL